MTIPYEEPALDKKAFNCPFCNAYANFEWSPVVASAVQTAIQYRAAHCAHCQKWTMWAIEHALKGTARGGYVLVGSLVNPFQLTSPLPHKDLPESCKSEYNEARQVLPF